jgi:hypothetical protein
LYFKNNRSIFFYDQVKDEMGRAYSTKRGEEECMGKILVGKPEGKRPLGRPRRRWVDNTKVDLREIEWDGVD